MEDAQHDGFAFVWIDDSVRYMAVEVKTIAVLERMCLTIKFKLDRTLLDHQELLAFVSQCRISGHTGRNR